MINKKYEFYKSIGYDTDEAIQCVERYLIDINLTNPRKIDISNDKKIEIIERLRKKFIKICNDKVCKKILENLNSVKGKKCEFSKKEFIQVQARNCDICRGSNVRKTALECIGVIDGRNIKILIIGYPGGAQEKIDSYLTNDFVEKNIEYELVDGDKCTKSSGKSLKRKHKKYDECLLWKRHVPTHKRTSILKDLVSLRIFDGEYPDLFRKISYLGSSNTESCITA